MEEGGAGGAQTTRKQARRWPLLPCGIGRRPQVPRGLACFPAARGAPGRQNRAGAVLSRGRHAALNEKPLSPPAGGHEPTWPLASARGRGWCPSCNSVHVASFRVTPSQAQGTDGSRKDVWGHNGPQTASRARSASGSGRYRGPRSSKGTQQILGDVGAGWGVTRRSSLREQVSRVSCGLTNRARSRRWNAGGFPCGGAAPGPQAREVHAGAGGRAGHAARGCPVAARAVWAPGSRADCAHRPGRWQDP